MKTFLTILITAALAAAGTWFFLRKDHAPSVETSAGRKPLCLTGHIDTVPLGTVPWTRDPFAGETDGDRLYGRGSTDMKAGVAAIVVVALELAPHLAGT
jgi:acetylornithine deacetylase/succinyl-diaminopimelate desuccinylase-like protein